MCLVSLPLTPQSLARYSLQGLVSALFLRRTVKPPFGSDQSGKEADHFATPWLHAADPETAWYSSACLTGSPDCNLAGELLDCWLFQHEVYIVCPFPSPARLVPF